MTPPLIIILLVVAVSLLLLTALLLVFFFSASRLSKYEPGEGDDIFLDKEEKHWLLSIYLILENY